MVFQFEPASLLLAISLFSFCLFTFNSQSHQSILELWDIPAFKTNIYQKLKIYYIIILVIIKHALVRKFNDTLVQYDDIKP